VHRAAQKPPSKTYPVSIALSRSALLERNGFVVGCLYRAARHQGSCRSYLGSSVPCAFREFSGVAGLAHSAWLATIGLLGASSRIVLSGAMFRVRLAFARNVPVVGYERRLLNQVKHATSACSRRYMLEAAAWMQS
jgi:hypothetical protein